MKPNTFRRTVNEPQISRVEDEITDGELYDDALSKASADYYERSWKSRIREQQSNIWIAVGLYLILSSVAFVVF
jgi:hypothetical protein